MAARVVERIAAGDPACGFDSETPPLDAFVAKHALGNDRRGLGVTTVLRRASDDDPTWPAVIGFYTLSMSSTESGTLPLRGLPR